MYIYYFFFCIFHFFFCLQLLQGAQSAKCSTCLFCSYVYSFSTHSFSYLSMYDCKLWRLTSECDTWVLTDAVGEDCGLIYTAGFFNMCCLSALHGSLFVLHPLKRGLRHLKWTRIPQLSNRAPPTTDPSQLGFPCSAYYMHYVLYIYIMECSPWRNWVLYTCASTPSPLCTYLSVMLIFLSISRAFSSHGTIIASAAILQHVWCIQLCSILLRTVAVFTIAQNLWSHAVLLK